MHYNRSSHAFETRRHSVWGSPLVCITENSVLSKQGRETGCLQAAQHGAQLELQVAAALEGFLVVDPDGTLWRTKHCAPKYRVIKQQDFKSARCFSWFFASCWGAKWPEDGRGVWK